MKTSSSFLRLGLACATVLLGLGAATGAPLTNSMKWGAVGHDDRAASGNSDPYNTVSISQQLDLLVNANLHWYRTGCTDSNCNQLAALASQKGISILRSIELRPSDKTDESGNYKLGYGYALSQAQRYRGTFVYYEASNELDVWVGVKGDGSRRTDYDPVRYAEARGFLRGLADGLKAGDPAAQVLIDDSGWCHYGFLQSLWADGVRWDITAVHWYASHGSIEQAGCNGANVLELHHSFGRPIWITEFNSDNAAKANDALVASSWIGAFMSELRGVASQYDVEAAFVYELLDEPGAPAAEQHYGIADSTGKPKGQQYQAVTRGAGIAAPDAPTQLNAK